MQIRPRAWWDAAWPLVDRMFGTPRQDADTVQARLRTPLDDALLARWNTDRTRAGAAAMIAAMDAIRDHDAAATLAALTVPTHFLFGEQGPAAECADAARRGVAHATSRIVPGAGHFVSIDPPAAFAAAVVRAAQGQGGTWWGLISTAFPEAVRQSSPAPHAEPGSAPPRRCARVGWSRANVGWGE